MSAEILRRAATLMRERAEACAQTAPSPWFVSETEIVTDDEEPIETLSVVTSSLHWREAAEQRAHVASWHPAVALAGAIDRAREERCNHPMSEETRGDHEERAQVVDQVLWLGELMAQEFGAYTEEHRARAAGYFAKRLTESRWLAAHVAAAEQRGREDNADHGMCYAHGSLALTAHDAAVRAEALRETAELLDSRRSTKGIASRALDAGMAMAVATLRDLADRLYRPGADGGDDR